MVTTSRHLTPAEALRVASFMDDLHERYPVLKSSSRPRPTPPLKSYAVDEAERVTVRQGAIRRRAFVVKVEVENLCTVMGSTQTDIARRLNIYPSVVSNWKKTGLIPIHYRAQFSFWTHGAFSESPTGGMQT